MRATLRSAAIALALCAASTAPALSTVIYVKANAAGLNDGSSWTNAFTSLQSALGAAVATDEIWVAAATYKPTATSDRTIAFALKNNVAVYGGFAGTETMRSQRDPVAHVTILSGDIGTVGSAADNSFHVVTTDATVTNTGKLDGFTVSGGQADGNPASNQDRGAGIWVSGGSALISGVTFTANFASFRGAGARVENGSPRFLGCTFVSNSVPFGAGGAGLSTGAGSVSLESCVFRSNSISGASTGGGGIQTAGNTTLLNCVVAQNSPNGLQIQGNNNSIQDSTFTANQGYGAAFLLSTGNTISNSVFWNDLVPEIFFDGSSAAGITYTDVQGGSPFAGTGNLNADPSFLSPPSDLRPGPLSPVVDAGNNNLVPGGTTLDIRGLPRFFDDPDVPDTGIGNVPPGVVDMGAYERIAITVSDPASQSICSTDTASFSVTAQGQPTLTYQWRKNGSNLSNGGAISGATTNALTINPSATTDSGNYDVVVTDGFGQNITSSTAVLTVNARPTAVAGGGGTVCSGDSVDLDGSGGNACSWLPTAGLSDPNSCTPTAAPASTTTYNLTVTGPNGCASANTASVLVTVNTTPTLPVITAPLSVPVGASGASASVVNHPGSTWTWTLSGGVITAGQGSRQIVFDAASPGTTMACTVTESAGGCLSPVAATSIQVDFLDIPPANAFHSYIIAVARNGVTAGCGGGNYCGTSPITRAQMAVFLLKAEHGSSYTPPVCQGAFADVPCPSTFANWIEQLAAEGVTGGCGGGNYCPTNGVTRSQMAVFLLKTSEGSAYTPPPATGTIFSDVSAGSFAAAWIEDLYSRNITGGCGTNPLRYCPTNINNRQQMAVFITKTFSLQ
ncbi:MAG TPA: right-handed parallel beta-helix repeat-containing protein [Thermoanaerobaculia bacterium]|nr:right-handed parallel beta-helix repeat-containing protein [Thermoanaerobaculia bacterium]